MAPSNLGDINPLYAGERFKRVYETYLAHHSTIERFQDLIPEQHRLLARMAAFWKIYGEASFPEEGHRAAFKEAVAATDLLLREARRVNALSAAAQTQISRPMVTREYYFNPLVDEKLIHLETLEYFTGKNNCNTKYWLRELQGIECLEIRSDPANKVCRILLFLKLEGGERDRIRINSLIDEFNNLMNAAVSSSEWLDAPCAAREEEEAIRQCGGGLDTAQVVLAGTAADSNIRNRSGDDHSAHTSSPIDNLATTSTAQTLTWHSVMDIMAQLPQNSAPNSGSPRAYEQIKRDLHERQDSL